MSPFQAVYDFIKNLKTPVWIKNILQVIQDILIEVCLDITKDTVARLEAKIIEVAGENLSNEAKFKKVFNYCRSELLITVKDNLLRLLIEALLARLKASKAVD